MGCAMASRSASEERPVAARIAKLVEEEHALIRLDNESYAPDEHERLSTIEAELNDCSDLLRERSARRRGAQSPPSA